MESRQLECENRFHYVARGVSFVVAFLVCLVVFLLPLPATGSEVPSALAMGNVPSLDQSTNGNAPPFDDTYLLAPAEEAEDADKDPLKSELLTMLLLTVCFGLSIGWLLRNTQRQGALCTSGAVGSSLASAREDLPFLGVFRL